MPAELPEIPWLRDRRQAWVRFRQLIGVVVLLAAANQEIDLAHLKTSGGHIEIKLHFEETLQFQGKQVAVPTGILGELVVGENVAALLRLGHIVDANGRDLSEAKQHRGLEPAMARNDDAVAIDEDRVGPAECPDRSRDLAELPLRV